MEEFHRIFTIVDANHVKPAVAFKRELYSALMDDSFAHLFLSEPKKIGQTGTPALR